MIACVSVALSVSACVHVHADWAYPQEQVSGPECFILLANVNARKGKSECVREITANELQ